MQYDNVCLISHYDATEFASRTPDYHTPHHIYILSTFAFRPLQMKNNPRFPKRHAKCNANGIIYTPTCRTQSPWLINETRPVPPPYANPHHHHLRRHHHHHPNHTHQNSKITAAKKPSQAFQPTPVFWAMTNIRFIVPLILNLEFSNWSFIFSARVVEVRISSPMRWVSCVLAVSIFLFFLLPSSQIHPLPHPHNSTAIRGRRKSTYILQHPNLTRQHTHMFLILTLQLIQHSRRVLAA